MILCTKTPGIMVVEYSLGEAGSTSSTVSNMLDTDGRSYEGRFKPRTAAWCLGEMLLQVYTSSSADKAWYFGCFKRGSKSVQVL